MSHYWKLRGLLRTLFLFILIIYITQYNQFPVDNTKSKISKNIQSGSELLSEIEPRTDVLISSKGVLKRGIFYFDEQKWTVDRNITKWNLGSHPGRISQSATISFLLSTQSLYSFCDVNISQPSLMVQLVYWPQHGHTLFN